MHLPDFVLEEAVALRELLYGGLANVRHTRRSEELAGTLGLKRLVLSEEAEAEEGDLVIDHASGIYEFYDKLISIYVFKTFIVLSDYPDGEVNKELPLRAKMGSPPKKRRRQLNYKCFDCQENFANVREFRDHANAVHGRGAFICVICGSCYQTKVEILNSMRGGIVSYAVGSACALMASAIVSSTPKTRITSSA